MPSVSGQATSQTALGRVLGLLGCGPVFLQQRGRGRRLTGQGQVAVVVAKLPPPGTFGAPSSSKLACPHGHLYFLPTLTLDRVECSALKSREELCLLESRGPEAGNPNQQRKSSLPEVGEIEPS